MQYEGGWNDTEPRHYRVSIKCELKTLAMIIFKLFFVDSKVPLVVQYAAILYSPKKGKILHTKSWNSTKMPSIAEILTCKEMCMLESMKYSKHVMRDCNGILMVCMDIHIEFTVFREIFKGSNKLTFPP